MTGVQTCALPIYPINLFSSSPPSYQKLTYQIRSCFLQYYAITSCTIFIFADGQCILRNSGGHYRASSTWHIPVAIVTLNRTIREEYIHFKFSSFFLMSLYSLSIDQGHFAHQSLDIHGVCRWVFQFLKLVN